MAHMAEHDRCAVFGRMGSGKTLATLTSVSAATELDQAPVLIIGPKRVAAKTWPDEALRWPHLRHLNISPILGTVTQRLAALSRDANVFTINYENLPWLVDEVGQKRWPFRTIIADESTKLKNFRTRQGGKRSAALSKIAWQPQIKRWINLTGTPSPNGLADLWGQTWFIDRGQRLGASYQAYMERWFKKDYDGYGSTALDWAQEQIHERLRDICVTIDPGDWIDIPEPIRTTIKVELPDKARRQYRQMEREMFLQIREHEIEAVHAAAKTIKCLALANGFIYLDKECTQAEPIHDAKIEALESVVAEACGTPVLVAYHFRADLQRLQKAFPQGRVFDSNPKTEDDWNEGRIEVMFIHPASGGHGVNLQYGGNILAFFGHWWDLEQRDQVLERIGPMRQWQSGQGRHVYVYDIVAENTVDEDVILRHETKRGVQDLLLESMKRRM